MKKILRLPYLILILLPILGFIGEIEIKANYIFSSRLLRLLWASTKLGIISSSICVILGLGAAIAIRSTSLYKKKSRWFFLLLAPVPYYIYALAWMYIVRSFANFLPAVTRSMSSGIWTCVFVNVMSFLPITTGLILLELEHQDEKFQEMALLYDNWNGVLNKIIVPGLLPIMSVSGILVFVLSVTDFSVPSLFQYNTYTLEIFSDYSKGLGLATVGLISLPLIVPVYLLILLLLVLVKKTSVIKSIFNKRKMEITGIGKLLSISALTVCVLQILVPTLSFIFTMGSLSSLLESLITCKNEFIVSFIISATAGLLAVIGTFPAVHSTKFQNSRLFEAIALIPLAIPSSLISMGLLSVINGSFIHELSRSFLFPALGCAIKYMPFAFLCMKVYGRHLDKKQLEMASCMMPSIGAYVIKILLPMYMPSLIGSFLITFLLSFGEESIGLILMPPGYQTLAVMIYNYLHYGASELVSGFCLVTILMTILLSLLLLTLLEHKAEKKYDKG